jgi:hypothetical protein
LLRLLWLTVLCALDVMVIALPSLPALPDPALCKACQRPVSTPQMQMDDVLPFAAFSW